MKKIYFDRLDSTFHKALMIPTLVFFGIYLYATLADADPTLKAISGVLGFGMLIFFLGKPFFYRNYVGWNKRGVTIKLNSFFSKTLSFRDIESFGIEKDQFVVRRINGSTFLFNIANIQADQLNRLQDILRTSGRTAPS